MSSSWYNFPSEMSPDRLSSDRQEEIPKFAVEKVFVAGNRGPCGGVNMALEAVNQVLEIVDGREPVYTNRPVVHNDPIMKEYEERGLIDVKNDWSKVPNGSIVIFSAHGVPPKFREIALRNDYLVIDTSCQLVTRVHNLVKRAEKEGKHIIYIGKEGHPETIGVMGEVREENITLIEKSADVEKLDLGTDIDHIVYSQTTLMTSETDEVEESLRAKFLDIYIPNRLGICYATFNRQAAVERLLESGIDSLIVVGSQRSHNSEMLRRMGERAEILTAKLDSPHQLDINWLVNSRRLGFTSGASVLDKFLEPVIDKVRAVSPGVDVIYQEQAVKEQEMTFVLPQESLGRLKARFS